MAGQRVAGRCGARSKGRQSLPLARHRPNAGEGGAHMLSRRDVLTTTIAAGAGLALPSHASVPAQARCEGRPIVDGQIHIWLASTPENPWPDDGIGQAHIPRPFSYYELLSRMNEAGVDRVVIVPPSWEGYHNEYAMGAAKKWPRRFA